MANISKIGIPNVQTPYEIKDAHALRLNQTPKGTAEEPYVLDYNDFETGAPSGIRVSYMDVSTSPNIQCNMGSTDWGDWYIYNMYGGNAKFGTLLAFGPRDHDHVFIGHFWDGVWSGWKFISTNAEYTDSTIFGEVETTGIVTIPLPDYVKTAKIYGVTIYGLPWNTVQEPLDAIIYHTGTYGHDGVAECNVADLNTKFGTNYATGQRLFFNVHLEW